MFGLFKKNTTPDEFGHAVFRLAANSLASDAGRSLGMRFENWDGSDGWPNFLLREGMSIPLQKLHYWLFSHCAVQAVSTQFDESTRRGITHGATVTGFSTVPEGYDFEKTYSTLEAVYRGQHKFDPRIEPLSNDDARSHYLPVKNAAALNAKYLIESFLIPNMHHNSRAFVDDFEAYSACVGASLGTVQSAMNHLFKSCKI